MSIEISRSVDIENKIRIALSDYLTAYCAPMPAKFRTPNILVQTIGGSSELTSSGKGKVDTFTVVLDARAKTEEESMEYLRNAVAILEVSKSGGISHVAVNSLYSWGTDPVRPDLAMCSATLLVTAHREKVTIS